MRVINIICDRIWIVLGLAAILEATLKSDCAWIPPCSFMPYHSSCNLIRIHSGHCCVLYWKPYQTDLDQPIWIFVIPSHLVDFKLIRIFAWHSLGHSEWPYLTFNYHTPFVETKFIYFCLWRCVFLFLCVRVSVKKRKRKEERKREGGRGSVWVSSVSVCSPDVTVSLIYRHIFVETMLWWSPHKKQ